MKKPLIWLSGRPWIALTLAAAYTVLIVWSHEAIQQAAFRAYDRFTRERVNVVVQMVGAALLILVVRFAVRAVRKSSQRSVSIAYGLLTAALIAASTLWLLFTDIEVVHFPQFAILAMLIFPAARCYTRTMFFTTLLGFADEAFQYYVSHPNWHIHLDFNDIILNVIGAGAGCLLLFLGGGNAVLRRERQPSFWKRRLRSPILWTTAALGALCASLWGAGLLTLYPRPDGTRPRFVIRRDGRPGQFWTTTSWGRRYHDFSPETALVVMAGIIGGYSLLDPIARRGASKSIETA